MIHISYIRENRAVGRLTEIVAIQSGTPIAQAGQIRTAAALHDVGKLRIPKKILNKPGKLTAEEFEIIKTHTVLGARMLTSLQGELGIMARTCCLYHHEWYNGGGYWGKHIGKLPFYVAILAITDVFTALVCKRSYKQAWPPEEALEHIRSKAGTQFDPALVDFFLLLVENDTRIPGLLLEVVD